MAYQGVQKCKFFIDYLSHFKTRGLIDTIELGEEQISTNNPLYQENTDDILEGSIDTIIGLDPVSPCKLTHGLNTDGSFPDKQLNLQIKLNQSLHPDMLDSIDYYGFLGHTATINPENFVYHSNSDQHNFVHNLNCYVQANDINGNFGYQNAGELIPQNEIINIDYNDSSHYLNFSGIEKSGFTLTGCQFDDTKYTELLSYGGNEHLSGDAHTGIDNFYLKFLAEGINNDGYYSDQYTADFYLNCITLGHTYTMTQSANLDLTMEIEFDGFDQKDSIGGSTFTNIRYTGQPLWGGVMNPWELNSNGSFGGARNGRRLWSLKFSYLDQKDVFSSNYMGNSYISEHQNSSDWDQYDADDYYTTGSGTPGALKYSIFDDDSISAKLLNWIGNGERFIFQSDSLANQPSDFAICTLDQDSMKIKQTAHRTYDISMKIREVW